LFCKLLNEKEISLKRNLLSSPFPLINSVVLGKQEGKIFSIGNNFFIIHKSGFSYFKHDDSFDEYDTLLNFFIQSKEIPAYFHAYDASQKLLDACVKNNKLVNIKNRNRIQLGFTGQEIVTLSGNIPEGYYLKRITKEEMPLLAVFNLDLENKFWKSEEDFLQNGFGYCMFSALHEPASICYTACIAGNVAEIDVATLQPYQQKNLAKKVVYEFLEHCIENNLIANWDCFEDNVGSLKTANSLGYKRVFEYKLLSIFNKQNDI
jgi:GNAT acetyltransferase